MKRALILVFVVVLALTVPVSSANADRLDVLGALEGTDVLEKIALMGGRVDLATAETLESGMVKVTIPMSERVLREAAKKSTAVKDPQTLAVFATLTEENFAGQIVSADLAPLIDFPYLFYFVTANFGGDVTKRATFQLRGGGGFRVVENLLYDAGAFNLFAVEHTVPSFGVRRLQVKVKGGGGGSIRQQLCFDCG